MQNVLAEALEKIGRWNPLRFGAFRWTGDCLELGMHRISFGWIVAPQTAICDFRTSIFEYRCNRRNSVIIFGRSPVVESRQARWEDQLDGTWRHRHGTLSGSAVR